MATKDDDSLEIVPRDNPALLIQDGDFGTPPAEWQQQLDAQRDLLKRIIPSVGRLEVVGSNRPLGTAFVAGLGILMTNRHVLAGFTDQQGGNFTIEPGVTVRVDFRQEHERTAVSEVRVDGVIGVHSRYDLALLRFTPTLDNPVKMLPLQRAAPPSPVRDREVVVIGYPDADLDVPEELIKRTFQNILGVKRLQPGRIGGLRQHDDALVFSHDCSTTGGNSGSCVVDLGSGQVIGLHFGGAGTANLAVPLWEVSDEAFLKDLHWV